MNTLFYAGHVPLNVTNDFGAVNPGNLAVKQETGSTNICGVPKPKVQVLGDSRQSKQPNYWSLLESLEMFG